MANKCTGRHVGAFHAGRGGEAPAAQAPDRAHGAALSNHFDAIQVKPITVHRGAHVLTARWTLARHISTARTSLLQSPVQGHAQAGLPPTNVPLGLSGEVAVMYNAANLCHGHFERHAAHTRRMRGCGGPAAAAAVIRSSRHPAPACLPPAHLASAMARLHTARTSAWHRPVGLSRRAAQNSCRRPAARMHACMHHYMSSCAHMYASWACRFSSFCRLNMSRSKPFDRSTPSQCRPAAGRQPEVWSAAAGRTNGGEDQRRRGPTAARTNSGEDQQPLYVLSPPATIAAHGWDTRRRSRTKMQVRCNAPGLMP
mgnify:CR=1 FL=1